MCCEEDLCDTLRTKNIMSFPGSSCTWQEGPGNEKGTSNKLQVPLARTLQLVIALSDYKHISIDYVAMAEHKAKNFL